MASLVFSFLESRIDVGSVTYYLECELEKTLALDATNFRELRYSLPRARDFRADGQTYCLWLTKYCLHSNIKDGNRYNFDDSTFRGRAKVTSICLLTCYNGNAAWGVLLSVLMCTGKLPSSKWRRFQSLFLNCSKRAGCPVTSRT